MLARSRLISTTSRIFNVLAIESSADDTCAAVVASNRKILSNVIIKQNHIHEIYGGIHPKPAIDSHQANMPFAVQRALTEAGVDLVHDIHGIAFTRGPGMAGCLSVGMNAAKTLAAALHKPLVGVNHMQGHALTPLLTNWPNSPTFPFLSLLVSGGHTLLLVAKSLTDFQILATTRDESIGRVFDKVSRLLELKWTTRGPGHALETFCEEISELTLPEIPPIVTPLIGHLEFSYSGLHSQVQRLLATWGSPAGADLATKKAIARVFQASAVAQLEEKLSLGLQLCKKQGLPIQHVVVSGGVASNKFLRQRIEQCLRSAQFDDQVSLVCPPPALCTDNAVMIAWASMHRFLAGNTDAYDIGLRPKWTIEDIDE